MEIKQKKYLIEFDFSYLDQVNLLLHDNEIIRRTFDNNVKYLIILEENRINQVFNLLFSLTHGNVKIHDLNKQEELPEPGTDKPIGSKSAIDEN